MQLSELQDKHKDEIIFIVGAGPSVNNIDVDLLKNHTVMAVNSGMIAVPFADYFLSDDPGIIQWSYFNNLEAMNCVCLFYKDRWRNVDVASLPEERVVFYNHKSWFSPPDSYNLPDGLILTKDINKPIVGARISFASGVHMAYCLGAKVIVLLGNDCRLSRDKNKFRYFWQYRKKMFQPFRISGPAFNQRTQNRGFDRDDLVEYWTKFADINKDNDVTIIDASDSCLDCFPKMSIREVLDKYGDK